MRKFTVSVLCLAALAWAGGAHAQSVKSISKVVSSVTGHFSSLDLTGTWKYSGSAISFESESLLKRAGGTVAANKIEDNIDGQLAKLGFQEGVTSFTFNADSTFTNNLNGKDLKGRYSYDPQTDHITLKYMNHLPVKAKVSGSSSKISLLFEANSFLSLMTFLGSHSGSSILGGISSIARSYDGMQMGIELQKK